jgi:hypothetical protein
VKRLGPELKMPDLKGLKDLKAPVFLADVYYDLRDRRLLPLVALVMVAIATVPFLLGDDAEELLPPPAPGAETAEEIAGASRLTVVEAKPGLRDYRKRLRNLTPTDPFKQRYTGVPKQAQLKSTGAGSEAGGGASEAGVTEEVEVAEPPADGGAPSGSAGGSHGTAPGGGKGKAKPPRLIEFVLDVQISRSEKTADGNQKMGEPKIRRRVRPLTQLPGGEAPVVTTMGVNLHTAKVMFLISDDVKSLDGEFKCVARTPDGICELLEVEPGFPFDLVYGPNAVRYRFKVTKVGAVRAGRVGDKRSSRAAVEAEYGAALEARFGTALVTR